MPLFFLLLFIHISTILLSQLPETPIITNVTVNHNTEKAEINWTVNSVANINGFIIKRKIVDGTGVVLGTYNTVATMSNNSTFFYEDVSTDYNTTSKPYQRIEYYSVIAYKEANPGILTFSNLSEVQNTIFLTSDFDLCLKKNNLNWNSYQGWNVNEYQVYWKTDVMTNFELLISTTDTSYNHQLTDTNQNYKYYIRAVGSSGVFSESNISTANSNSSTLIDYINANYATVTTDNQIEISFTNSPNNSANIYKLVRSISPTDIFDTIADFDGNQLNILFSDNSVPTSQYFYKLVAKDNCNVIIGESNIASNIVLSSEINNSQTRANNLTWNSYYQWLGNTDQYKIFSSFEDEEFVELTTLPNSEISYLHDITDYIFDIYKGTIPHGKFCYYVESNEINNPFSINGLSKSNISCIIQEPIIFFPTAFNPNSSISENAIFKPKLTFINNYLFIIYSDWGNKLFETTDPAEGWTGKTSSGNLLMRGTYIYYVRVIDESGKVSTKTGYVNLMY